MDKRHWTALALLAAGCGTAALEITTPTDEERVDQAEHRLGARLRAEFGPEARVTHVVQEGERALVGVAVGPAPADGDALPPVAFAIHAPATDALDVLARDFRYREARLHGERAALVTTDGELHLVEQGVTRALAHGVRGDVAFLPSGEGALVTMMGESLADGETRVTRVDLQGRQTVIADSEGVDDRPAIAPDGHTVVFVSGRTGVASFFRTTLDGAPPVQLTNVGLEPGEDAPAGFVPPPVNADRLEWLDADTLRFDAGGGELWTLDIRTGAAASQAGAR